MKTIITSVVTTILTLLLLNHPILILFIIFWASFGFLSNKILKQSFNYVIEKDNTLPIMSVIAGPVSFLIYWIIFGGEFLAALAKLIGFKVKIEKI